MLFSGMNHLWGVFLSIGKTGAVFPQAEVPLNDVWTA
jgi:hypothetical protein